MKILYVASEAYPYIASGGLADVAGSLPRAINSTGHECRVVLPFYANTKPAFREKLKYVGQYYIQLAWRNLYCGIFEGEFNGVTYYLIDNKYYFDRPDLYGYFDDAERFAFFSLAAVELAKHIDYFPDVINVNDWQTAMVPVYLNFFYRSDPRYAATKTVFTIHNIQYQGQFANEIATDVLGIPKYAASMLEYDECINMMKAAIDQCDKVSTVSPTYSFEIRDPWFGHGLDRLLRDKAYKLTGILNGIDNDVYDPRTDKALYRCYSDEEGKRYNKNELKKSLGLQDDDALLVGIVTRLVSHKGIDLIRYVFDEIIREGMQVVLLGSGDYIYEDFFNEMQRRYPGRVSVTIGFIPDLARKIYSGADVFLMPSQSEPCGLAQMVSLRYGTMPIVRETGGLVDSIKDVGGEGGNGYTFKTYEARDMLNALLRAKRDYYDHPGWSWKIKNAMGCDFSWSRSALEYIRMYSEITQLPMEIGVAHEEETIAEATTKPAAIKVQKAVPVDKAEPDEAIIVETPEIAAAEMPVEEAPTVQAIVAQKEAPVVLVKAKEPDPVKPEEESVPEPAAKEEPAEKKTAAPSNAAKRKTGSTRKTRTQGKNSTASKSKNTPKSPK